MAYLVLFFVLVLSLIQYPQPAGDGLDEVMHQRMLERQELLEKQMAQLLQELEQQDQGWGAMLLGALQQWAFWIRDGLLVQYHQPAGDGLDEAMHQRMLEGQQLLEKQMAQLLQELEQQDQGWGAMLLGALQQWPLWLLAGLVLLLGLCFRHRSRSHEASSSSKDQSSCETLRDEQEEEQEEDGTDSEAGRENTAVTVEADDSGHCENDREGNPVAANDGGDRDTTDGNNDEKVKEESDVKSVDGQESKKNEGWRDENVPRDNSGEGSEDDPGKVAGRTEGLEKANEGGKKDGQVEQDRDTGKEQEEAKEGNVAASDKEGRVKNRSGSGGIEDREESRGVKYKRGTLLVDHVEWPVEELERGCSVTAELMERLTRVFVDNVSHSFEPVPQEAIGVGSAFEGWSPYEWDGVYRVLVPLSPPAGHAFHLEPNSAGQMAARTFGIRVELVCTCKREQPGEKLLCFLHLSQEELQQKQKRSLLETLCTGSYLDVEKTSHWFYELVRSSWLHVPQSHSWDLVFQPCSRSCNILLSRGKKSVMVEMLFGVRQGDSDIFVVSQPTEAQKGDSSLLVSSEASEANSIASIAWPETYAVAEVKFFQHVSRQMPSESLHLKCLQVFTCVLRDTGFSSSTWKTVVMHMLTTVPLSRWHKREFVRRLGDIIAHLRRCLQLKCLEHFVLGNQNLPAEISLPPAVQGLEPLNLFEHLARDPAAHREAMRAFSQLRLRLWMLLSKY